MRPPYSVLARRMGPGGAGAPKGRRARNKPEIRRKNPRPALWPGPTLCAHLQGPRQQGGARRKKHWMPGLHHMYRRCHRSEGLPLR